MAMIQGDTVRIYSNPDNGRRENYPFEGWRYYTEYIHTENGISCASGVNREMVSGNNTLDQGNSQDEDV